MSQDPVKPWLETHRSLGTATRTEAVNTPQRGSPYGEAYVQTIGKGAYQMADEGSYFVATNPTPGTAIAGIAGTGAFSDAESLLYIKNAATAAEATRLYLDYIRLFVVVAGTNGTNHRYVMKLEPANVERYTSGGSAITAVNPNMDSTETPAATIKFGALVTTAASADVRLIANGNIRTVITVAGDVYDFDFGGAAKASAGMPLEGTLQAHIVRNLPPVVLGPGCTFVMSLHAASQTVASEYEFEIGFWQR